MIKIIHTLYTLYIAKNQLVKDYLLNLESVDSITSSSLIFDLIFSSLEENDDASLKSCGLLLL
jgi:hypothetical protein